MFQWLPTEDHHYNNFHHFSVMVLIIIQEIFKQQQMTIYCAIMFKVVDKRISAFHFQLLVTLHNLSFTFHKFYIFEFVQVIGMLKSQIIMMVISVSFFFYIKDKIYNLKNYKLSEWQISQPLVTEILSN